MSDGINPRSASTASRCGTAFLSLLSPDGPASSDTSDDATYQVAIEEDRDDEYDPLGDGNPVDINLE